MQVLDKGLVGEREWEVTEDYTAARWGSGALDVFSTPALVGLMESAAMAALEGKLEPGQTTVGGHIDVQHLAATPIGSRVRARAELTSVEGRKLTFAIQAWDEHELIGEAVHDRYVIDAKRFLSRLQEKQVKP
jgi:fluoroacetyl-CoA thioesterase